MSTSSRPPEQLVPYELGALEGPTSFLARAAAADTRVFSLTGRRATAWGNGLHGVRAVEAAGWTLLHDLETRLGPASNVIVDPGCVRRELMGAEGTVLETLLVCSTAPAAVLQLRRPEGSGGRLEMELAWTVTRRNGAEVRGESFADGVRLWTDAADTESDGACALLIARPVAVWRIETEGGEARIRARVTADSEQAITLLLAGGANEGDALAALKVVAATRTEEMRAEHELEIARREGLATHTGVEALDEGLEWAKARLRSGARASKRSHGGARASPDPVTDVTHASISSPTSSVVAECWTALGALAAGDLEPAETLLAGDYPTPYHLVVAARYVGWSGATGSLFPYTNRLDEAARAVAKSGGSLRSIALRELADAWESCGDKQRAATLRGLADAGGQPGARGRRLPVVGAAGSSTDDVLVAGVLGSSAGELDRPPSQPPRGGVEGGLWAWARCRAGDPEAGYRMLRDHLEAGFDWGWGIWGEPRGDGEIGTARTRAPSDPDGVASAATIPGALLFGLLGASADAAYGRLRLAPRFPAAWSRFRVTGIRVGDALVELDYERDALEHVFRVRQRSGRIPLMLVFEPEVPEPALEVVRVDGTPAQLDCRSDRGRTALRVQLPLDREREVRAGGKRSAGTSVGPGVL